MSAVVPAEFRCSGRMSTPGAPTAPAVASMVRKVMRGDDPAVMDVAPGKRGGKTI